MIIRLPRRLARSNSQHDRIGSDLDLTTAEGKESAVIEIALWQTDIGRIEM